MKPGDPNSYFGVIHTYFLTGLCIVYSQPLLFAAAGYPVAGITTYSPLKKQGLNPRQSRIEASAVSPYSCNDRKSKGAEVLAITSKRERQAALGLD